ncbi:MAG: 16S rRNA (cytidine(1402)-2'-O)-methyltransferase [Chromatiales bacterium]|nr:16S rRNA (cytidine(1402)-2'-O)-methyltransferase [Chromatiales bacterium]
MKAVDSEGVLYIVATPIGNLADFSHRAVEVLRKVDCILCEDTRTSSVLLKHYRLTTPKTSLHAHNEAKRCTPLIEKLKQGQRFALISDAGTPLLSDAGRLLVTACHNERITVVPIPGANAVATALSAAGFDGSRFVFEGFLPATRVARIKRLQYLKRDKRTLVFFEAPHRITATITDMIEIFGQQRTTCLAKELTKIHERMVRGNLLDIQAWLLASAKHTKGEFVILIGDCDAIATDEVTINTDDLVQLLSEYLSPSKAAAVIAKLSGMPRKYFYRTKSHNRNSSETQDAKHNDKIL